MSGSRGLRVVADPAALDAATWRGPAEVTVLRLAPDDAFAIGATEVDVDDEHAIVEPEPGFAGAWCRSKTSPPRRVVAPDQRPALAQGAVANVPASFWLPDDGDALLITAAAYADELASRLR